MNNARHTLLDRDEIGPKFCMPPRYVTGGWVYGWQYIDDIPVDIAKQFDPIDRAWTTDHRGGVRSIVYDIGNDWYRATTLGNGNVYYQHWSNV